MLPLTTQTIMGLPGLELQGLITLILQFFCCNVEDQRISYFIPSPGCAMDSSTSQTYN